MLIEQIEQIEQIETVRATNPIAADMIKDFLIPDSDYSRTDISEDIKNIMTFDSSNIFVLIAWKDSSSIIGFVIGWLVPNKSHAWLQQVYIDNHIEDRSIVETLFERFLHWVSEKGIKEIRTETTKTPRGLLRRFGFHVLSHTLTRTV